AYSHSISTPKVLGDGGVSHRCSAGAIACLRHHRHRAPAPRGRPDRRAGALRATPSDGAVAAPAAPAAVDRTVLAQSQADLGGDPAIVVELIDLFLEDMLTLLAQIDR